MPHTNRKKRTTDSSSKPTRKPIRQKVEKLEDENGWTHIVGGRKAPLKFDETSEKLDFFQTGDFAIDGHQYSNKSIDEVKIEADRYQKQWETSTACRELKERLVGFKEGKDIDNVVCLGLGSLQNVSNHFCRTSHVQLVALSTILEILDITNARKVSQDPAFTELDKNYLISLGFEVTDSPSAFEQINSKSLVYAVHCYPQVYESISNGARPVVFIGNDLSYVTQWGSAGKESMLKAIEDFAKDYDDVLEFPRFRYDFSDTKVYSRKTAEAMES